MSASQPPLGSPVVPRKQTDTPGLPPVSNVRETEVLGAPQPALGSPDGAVKGCEPVSEQTEKRLRETEEEEQRREEDLMRGRIFGGVPEVRVPAFLLNSTFALMLAAIVSLVVLFLYAQTIFVLAQVPLLPKWLQYVSYAVVFVLFVLVAGFCGRLVMLYCRLRTTRRIRLQGMEELNGRARMRRLCAAEASAARAHLLEYLANYPSDEKRLLVLGFTRQQAELLHRYKAELTDQSADLGAAAWIEHFKKSFQKVLDEATGACIRRHALRVALRTAALPFALADTLVVLYSSVSLIGDLCKIYNLRLGRFASLVVTGWAAIQSVLAGRIEDSSSLDSLNDAVLNTFGEHVQAFAIRLSKHAPAVLGGLAGSPLGPVGAAAGAQVGEKLGKSAMRAIEQALLQGVLLTRLGKRTQGWLRMVE